MFQLPTNINFFPKHFVQLSFYHIHIKKHKTSHYLIVNLKGITLIVIFLLGQRVYFCLLKEYH
jgi:hypothetical protein